MFKKWMQPFPRKYMSVSEKVTQNRRNMFFSMLENKLIPSEEHRQCMCSERQHFVLSLL